MKYLKFFEEDNFKNEPKIGDYVVCTITDYYEDMEDFIEFIENEIGQIVNIGKSKEIHGKYYYEVQYEDMPIEIEYDFGNPTTFPLQDILYSSSNKKDCEIFLKAKKYNL